jgi:hypothetical protein
LAVNKYAGHLPLCCQSQTFNRDGINLERSTLQIRPNLDQGILEIGNNAAETGMRAIAIGRKAGFWPSINAPDDLRPLLVG